MKPFGGLAVLHFSVLLQYYTDCTPGHAQEKELPSSGKQTAAESECEDEKVHGKKNSVSFLH